MKTVFVTGRLEEAKARKAKKEARKNAGTYVTGGGSSTSAAGHSTTASHSTASAHSTNSAPSSTSAKSTGSAGATTKPASSSTSTSSDTTKAGKGKGKEVTQRGLPGARGIDDMSAALHRREEESEDLSSRMPKKKVAASGGIAGTYRQSNVEKVAFVSGRLAEAKARKAKKEERKNQGTSVTGGGSSSGAAGHSTTAGHSTSAAHQTTSAGHTTAAAHSTTSASAKSTISASSTQSSPPKGKGNDKGKQVKERELSDGHVVDHPRTRTVLDRREDEDAVVRRQKPKNRTSSTKQTANQGSQRGADAHRTLFVSGRLAEAKARKEKKEQRKNAGTYITGGGSSSSGASGHSTSSGHTTASAHQSTSAGHTTSAAHHTASVGHTTASAHSTGSVSSTTSSKATASAHATTKSAPSSTSTSSGTSKKGKDKGKGVAQRELPESVVNNADAETVYKRDASAGRRQAQALLNRRSGSRSVERDVILSRQQPKHSNKPFRSMTREGAVRNDDLAKFLHSGSSTRFEEAKARKAKKEERKNAGTYVTGGGSSSGAFGHSTSAGHTTSSAHQTVSAGHTTTSAHSTGGAAASTTSAKSTTSASSSTKSAPSSTSAGSSSSSKGKGKGKGKGVAQRGMSEDGTATGADLLLDRDTDGAPLTARMPKNKPKSNKVIINKSTQRNMGGTRAMFITGRLTEKKAKKDAAAAAAAAGGAGGSGSGSAAAHSHSTAGAHSSASTHSTSSTTASGTTASHSSTASKSTTTATHSTTSTSAPSSSTSKGKDKGKKPARREVDEMEGVDGLDKEFDRRRESKRSGNEEKQGVINTSGTGGAGGSHGYQSLRITASNRPVDGTSERQSHTHTPAAGTSTRHQSLRINASNRPVGGTSGQQSHTDTTAAGTSTRHQSLRINASNRPVGGTSERQSHTHTTAAGTSTRHQSLRINASNGPFDGTRERDHGNTQGYRALRKTAINRPVGASQSTATTSTTNKGQGTHDKRAVADRTDDGGKYIYHRGTLADDPDVFSLLTARMPVNKKGPKSKKVTVGQAEMRNQGGFRAMTITGRLTEKKAKKDAAAAAAAKATTGAGGSGSSSTAGAHSTTSAAATHSSTTGAHESSAAKTTTTAAAASTTSSTSKTVDKGKGKAPKERSESNEDVEFARSARRRAQMSDKTSKRSSSYDAFAAFVQRSPPRAKEAGPSSQHLNQAKTQFMAKQPLTKTLKTVGPSEKYNHVPKNPAKQAEKTIPNPYRHLMEKKLKPAEKGTIHRPVPDPHA